MERMYLMNVVYYDGVQAYVSKFIGRTKAEGEWFVQTKETEVLIKKYLDGNGEVLKIDPLYCVSLKNIIAMQDSEDPELRAAYMRFEEMWF